MRQLLIHHFLILLTSLVFFTNLGSSRLWDRDEPRNAGCAVEMMAHSDWVVPIFNDELRTAKPVLLYWLMISAYSVFGVTEFAARFWSVLCGVGTVLITYHIGRRLFNPEIGFWSALLLTTSLMFNVAARAATPDSVLIFCSALSLLVFCWTGFPDFPRSWTSIVLMYGAMGVGVLAKGPVGCVLPIAVIGMFLLIVRLEPQRNTAKDLKENGYIRKPLFIRLVRLMANIFRPFSPMHFFKTFWAMRPLTGIFSILLVALPWYVWVGIRTDGEWVEKFFWIENFGRAIVPMENHHGSPFYYPVAILAGFFPVSIFVGAICKNTVAGIGKERPDAKSYTFLLCWIGVYVSVFTIAQTKLPSYVTPTYPALALLSGGFLVNWFEGKFNLSPLRGTCQLMVLVVVGILLSVGAFVASNIYLPSEPLLWLVGLVPILGGTVCLWFFHRDQRRYMATAFVITGMLMCVSLFGWAATRVSNYQQSDQLFTAIEQQSQHPNIASYGCLEPSWVFYSGRTIQPCRKGPDAVADFLNKDKNHFVITTKRRATTLMPNLSDHIRVLADVPYFLKKDRLLVLGHQVADVHSVQIPSVTIRK